ncbi:hypothetical protein JCM19047_3031 [Bacillus sp. JCM 19047]|nr:hypothetical protein JCM19047_3031 [Bacillus sp. JCM 19047]
MIRKAVMTDCQAIHQLIRSSFQIYKHDPVTASAFMKQDFPLLYGCLKKKKRLSA